MSTAAAGGLRPGRPDQHYEPPAGGQATPGQRAVVRAREVIISGSGPNFGIFVYSPSVGLGNLIASITAANGTDSVGNATVSGFTSYRLIGGTFYAYQVGLGNPATLGIAIWSAATAAGPYNNQGAAVEFDPSFPEIFNSNFPWSFQNAPMTLQQSGGQELLSLVGFAAAALPYIHIATAVLGDMALGVNVSGDADDRFTLGPDGTMTWGPGNAAGDTTLGRIGNAGLDVNINHNNVAALAITNAGTNAGQSLIQLLVSSATDRFAGMQAAGDTGQRIRFDAFPLMEWGPGNAPADTTFGRAAAQQWFSDGIAAKVGGNAAEVWHAVGGTGNAAFANGWANAATGPNLQYRLAAAPYNCIQWVGRLVAPAGVVPGQTITTSPASTYHPNNFGDIMAWDATASAIVMLRIGTGGALSYQSGSPIGNGDVIIIPVGNGMVSLDA